MSTQKAIYAGNNNRVSGYHCFLAIGKLANITETTIQKRAKKKNILSPDIANHKLTSIETQAVMRQNDQTNQA